MKRVVRINESVIRSMVETAVKQVLKEGALGQNFYSNVPDGFKKQVLSKAIQENPNLEPTGFYWVGGNLKHNGKKKKTVNREIIKKPEGMSDIEFLTTIVPKYNTRYAKGLSKLLSDNINKLEWKPLDISTMRDLKTSEMFSERYWICNLGAVTTEYPDDASKCRLSIPYFDRSTKHFQINLRIYEDGVETAHLCPGVITLVRNAFGDEAAEKLKEVEKAQLVKGTALEDNDETEF